MHCPQNSWKLGEHLVTDENLFNKRRSFIKLGAATVVANSAVIDLLAKESSSKLQPTKKELITSYNNFYEFTTDKKKVKSLVHTFEPSPWKIEITGLVKKDLTLDLEDLLKFENEERIYRFRCVEGWAMVVPWRGFALAELIKKAQPLKSAKYIRFETLYDPAQFPDQDRGFFSTIDYPYVEGLRMDEAMHELSFLATGLYGKDLPKQNGAPIRLVVPWKYGFKSIKSIAKIEFTEKQPLGSWEKLSPEEYGFYANVNPHVDHPRWSQKRERLLGDFFKQDTQMFNGYEAEVAHLYKHMNLKKFF